MAWLQHSLSCKLEVKLKVKPKLKLSGIRQLVLSFKPPVLEGGEGARRHACGTDQDGAKVDEEGLGEAGHGVAAEQLVLEAGGEAVRGQVGHHEGQAVGTAVAPGRGCKGGAACQEQAAPACDRRSCSPVCACTHKDHS